MNKPAIIVDALLTARQRTGSLSRDELAEVVGRLAFLFDQDQASVTKEAAGSGRLAQLLRAIFGISRRRRTSDFNEKLLFASIIAGKIANGMSRSEALRSHQEELRASGQNVEFDALEKKYERLGVFG